jgi:MFS family permease
LSGALALLRRRPEFRALWAAIALSYAGSGAAITALALYVQQTHGTGTAVGALMIAESAPRLLGPLAGSIADRVDLRGLLIGADLGQAALFGALALLPHFAALLGLVAITSFLQTAYGPARSAAVPRLVEEDELLTANALIGLAINLFVAVGPLVGGILFAVGDASLVLVVNAVSFVGSALLTTAVRPLHPEKHDEREGFLASTRAGIRTALADPLVRTVVLTLFSTFALLAIDNVALVFLVRDTLGAGAAVYGVVSATFGIGMVAASLAIAGSAAPRPARLYLLSLGLCAGGAVLTGLMPTVALVGVVMLIAGAGNGVEIVASETILHQRVPRAMLGRVYGVMSTATAAGLAISMGFGGLLVDATSARTAFILAGAAALLIAIAAAPTLLRR